MGPNRTASRPGFALWLSLLGAGWALQLSAAHADDFGVEHYESPAARAQGGTDVTSAIDVPSNGALEEESSIEPIRFDERATVTEGARGVRAIKDILRIDFATSSDPLRELELVSQQLQDVQRALGHGALIIQDRTRLEFANVRIAARTGQFQVGGYSHVFAAVQADLPVEVDLANIRADEQGPYLDLGKPRRVAAAQALSESGVRFGYGRAFALGQRPKLAVGAALRGFGLARTALHVLDADAIVRGEEDIDRPHDVRWHSGGGIGVDLHAALDIRDPFVYTRVGLRLEDAASLLILEHGTEFRRPRLALGLQFSPFYRLNDTRTIVQLDLENLQRGVPAIQLGLHHRFGGPLYYARPAIGGCFLEKDWFGNLHSPHLTFGLGAKLAWLFLQLTAEWMAPWDEFEAALSVGFSGR